MRITFANTLITEMEKDSRIYLLTADMGYGVLDKIKALKNFYNVGAAEQLMIGMAVGLAQAGKIPVCYSITSFLLYRPFEIIRNYLHNENCNVKLVGSGRDKEYAHDGFTHWCEDDKDVLKLWPNIVTLYPKNTEVPDAVREMLYNGKPTFLSLSRFGT